MNVARVIRELPSDLVDQIAAGEVVERPASMAKELVENALDAGATHVRVTFQEGGVAELGVSDNGHGMDPSQVGMAFKRHATSKISTLEDLARVHSFGFRGEAIASIASVSRMTIASCVESAESGVAMHVHGGTHMQTAPVGMARGTNVTVRELFYNVPARRKFLKSTATESAHITDVVTALALTAPHAHIELVRDGRTAINLPVATDLGARAAQVFEARVLLPISADRGPLRLQAWLCETPSPHPRDLWVFVNARWVKDRVLARAVADAMRERLLPGTYPAGVVHVHIDPSLVDVNVHPQKTEVRFADPRTVYDLLSRELGDRLRHAAGQSVAPASASRTSMLARREVPAPRSVPSPSPSPAFRQPVLSSAPSAREPAERPVFRPQPAPASPTAAPVAPARTPFYARLRGLGQTAAGYLLCEGDDALYVMDPRAMRERVMARPGQSAEETAGLGRVPPEGLSPAEVRGLLDALDDCDFSLPCVHPRPVLFRIGHDELARRAGAP